MFFFILKTTSPHHLSSNLSLLLHVVTIIKQGILYRWVYFWTFQTVLLVFLFFFDSFLHCFNFLGFCILFVVYRGIDSFWEVFFFYNLYFFHVHFITRLFNFISSSSQISTRVALYFWITLGEVDIFTIENPDFHRYGVFLHYFSFCVFFSNIL